MSLKHVLKKKKRSYHRSLLRTLSKGTVTPSLFIILLIVLILFLGSMFVTVNSNSSNANNGTTNPALAWLQPYLQGNTDGGLKKLALTPFPTYPPEAVAKSSCKLITNDIMLLIDNSGSMKGQKLKEAKFAAKIFVQLVAINPENKVGLVVFNRTSSVMSQLTSDFALLNAQIDRIGEGSNTCIQCGVLDGNRSIGAALREDVKRSIVLLSDGKSNHVDGKKSNNAQQAALDEVKKGYAANGTAFYTIAFGNDANTGFMDAVARDTGGEAYASATEKQLTQAFTQAATDICEPENGALSR